MREPRSGGAVVAAVVAVVEKPRPPATVADEAAAAGRPREAATGEGLQSALEAFDVVADDVERTFAGCWRRWGERRRREAGGRRAPPRRADAEDAGSGGSETDSESESTTGSSGEHVVNETLSTIEEERNTGSAQSFRGIEDEDSSIEDESTLKGQTQVWSGNDSNISSTSDLSTSSGLSSNNNLKDSSTRCDSDFRWVRGDSPSAVATRMDASPPTSGGGKPPSGPHRDHRIPRREKTAPGSLDRRRPGPGNLTSQTRQERDQKARSSHVLRSPPRLEDFQPCTGWCCNPNSVPYDAGYSDSFHRRHESSDRVPGRLDPHRYGSSPLLVDREQQQRAPPRWSDRGSHPDIFGECGGTGGTSGYYPRAACCSYHAPPPTCHCCYGERGYRWTPPPYPKPGEQDEKFRKIQYEKDNLQLQVQVLSEQIEAQSDKISDLEKVLQEKKHLLSEAEEKLQKEMLARSSLETQKLELMSIMSELKLQAAALERENLELRSSQYNNSDIKKPPLIPRMPSQPQLTSTPVVSNQALNIRMSPSPSPVGISSNSPNKMENTTITIQHESQSPKTPPAHYKRQIDVRYSSLPRQQFLSDGVAVPMDNGGPAVGAPPQANGKRGVAFGRALPLLLVGGRRRGHSVPNLAETDKIIEDTPNESPGSPSLSFGKGNKGIKKIFGKMKRSGSGNLEDLPGMNEFQRGGVRATAAARLGWSEPQLSLKPDKPFAEWDTENVCDWLQDLGLDQYVQDAKRWVKTGQQLQEASINEVEKELNIKNPLHRKKLQLALIDTQENSSSDPLLTKAGKLDTAWVLRWLDDAGLPQHKENFLINRVDGRVLHRLTMDDLTLLHVTSLLHVASIKRGIQVLRENDYEPACLQRRSLPEEPENPTAKQISLWTTHRVMEWLRAVDLAEYAPNLRGAGVHGGLMVLEPRFTAELLAALLSIPPVKTLLRRHLSTRFKELLGHEVIKGKREAEATLGYVPLTPSSKLKVSKKAQFSLKRKKSKGEADYGDLVCPLNPERTSDDESRPRGRGCLSSR